MSKMAGRSLQHRRGLINGAPDINNGIDEKELRRHIDRNTYLAFAVAGVVFGSLIALYLIG